jgi:hypothetical protein
MVDDDEPDLTSAELAALNDLPREVQPPRWLEDRVVAALQLSRPQYRHAFRRWSVWGWRAAAFGAAVMLFIGGFLVGGRKHRVVSADAEPQLYVLLTLEDADFRPPAGVPRAALAREYDAWAQGLSRKGQLVLGEALADSDWLLKVGRPLAELSVVDARARGSGFFLLRATSEAQALALARSCPHLRYGGRVELRHITPNP